MATAFATEMMRQCCSAEGKLQFTKMKEFMEKCGKERFAADELQQMKELCCGEGEIDCETVMQFMKGCGCRCE